MHEYSIVRALIDRVGHEAAVRGATSVHRVSVRIGALSGVEPTLLATAFETFRDGTPCHAAALDIAEVAAEWSCPVCGERLAPGSILRCAICDRPARLTAGDEILLEQIEMEVP